MRDLYQNRLRSSMVQSLMKGTITDHHWLLSDSILPTIAKAFFLINFNTPLAKLVLKDLPLPPDPPKDLFPAVSSMIRCTLSNPAFPPYMAAAFEQGCMPLTSGWRTYFKTVLNHKIARQLVRLSLVENGDDVLPPVVVRVALIDPPGVKPQRSFYILQKE